MHLSGYGYGDTLAALRPVAPTASANRVLYRHGALSEWYSNGPIGLEQGFTLTARPAGRQAGPLTLALALSGNARGVLARGRGGVTFSHDGSSLFYRGLVVTDARGRTLPAWLALHRRELLLRVNDAGARYPLRVDPFIQQAKLTASDGAANDNLGSSVAIQGNTIVVGAPGATINGNPAQGAVYVFVKPPSGWAKATKMAKLTASDGAANDQLGFAEGLGSSAVAISGHTIAASASSATVNGNPGQGAVYVFVEPKTGWHNETETAKLTVSNGTAGDFFGSPVAIQGNTVVAGALGRNGFQGAAYVFIEPTRGWRNETEAAQLMASDLGPSDTFGSSAAIQGNTVVIGSPANDGLGAVYVYLKPVGRWRTETETAKLTPGSLPAGDFPLLGVSVAIDGNTVVAGTEDSNYPGSVYVFTRSPRGWRSEPQTATLTASNGSPGDLFGTWTSVSGNTVVAGSGFGDLGAAYVFVEPTTGWKNATETAQLTGSDAGAADAFGWAVGMNGSTIVATAPFATVNGNAGQGAAYVFARSWGDWPSIAENASQAGHIQTRAAVRRPGRCTPDVARDRALTPLVLLGRSRNRPEC
jgi:hypothetical protein